jgi:hypothetical protein
MTRYAQKGELTQFNEGGLHSQNPNGGIIIGDNASVEQGETLKDNFVYSNRIFLDENIISQYNLPKSLVGKSVADATKYIDDKFKGRNDKISQSTKNGMLSKIAEAQEAMKPQEPEIEQESIDPSQMAFGGFAGSTIGQGFSEEATGAQQSNALGAGLGVATTGLDLGMTAFGKPTQNTDGLAASEKVNKGGMIASGAVKGATAGMTFGPWGAAAGAVIGAGAGVLGSEKAEKAALQNSNAYASNQNRQYSDQYAYGGKVKKMADGGYYDNNRPYFMTNPGPIKPVESIQNMTPSLGLVNELKPVDTTVPYTIGTQPRIDVSNANRQITPGPSDLDMLKYNAKKVGNYVNENAGNLARYAPIAANAYQLSQLKAPQGERLDRLSNRYKPEYVDEAALQNIADNTMNNSVNAIGQSGASQGQLRSSIIGSQLQRTKALSDAYSNAAAQNRATNDRAQTFNLGVDQVNLGQSTLEKDINARDQAAYRNEKSKYISAIGEGIGDVGKEQVQKKMISTATGYTYDGKYVKSPDGNIVVDPDTGEAMTGEKMKTLQASKNVKKQSLGGYLIKNKLK